MPVAILFLLYAEIPRKAQSNCAAAPLRSTARMQAAQKDLRGEAREKSTSGGVLSLYVDARRLSATKPMSLFHQLA
jgi:hypothetical protein